MAYFSPDLDLSIIHQLDNIVDNSQLQAEPTHRPEKYQQFKKITNMDSIRMKSISPKNKYSRGLYAHEEAEKQIEKLIG